MKKLYVSGILYFFFGLVLNAQTLTVSNHAPTVADTYSTTDCSTLTPGSPGTGQTWNFTSVNITTVITGYSVVTAASTGSAANYPSASLAVQSGTNNTFYSETSNDLRFWGGTIQTGTISVELTYTANPAISAIYPMSYGNSTTTPVSGIVKASGLTGSFSGTASIIADGTGTLNLPGSTTFSNVLRVQTTQTLNFTMNPPLALSGTVTFEIYDFYSPGLSKTALMTISTAGIASPAINSSQTTTSIKSYIIAGIKESMKEVAELKIYPNPATESFNLSFSNENGEPGSFEILNALGQTIRKETIGRDKGNVRYTVNLDGINSGIYFVKVNCGNSSSVKKITVE